MKYKILFISAFTAFVVFMASCGNNSSGTKNHAEMQSDSSSVYYTCTMHPEIHSDKPGNCPKCGMELVEKKVDKSDSTHVHNEFDSTQHK